jgi:putative membrane protein
VSDALPDPSAEEVVVEPPTGAEQAPPLSPSRMAVVGAVGMAMGVADTVPGFSGGTVALLAGVYERLIANVRQGAHALALLARGALADGLRAIVAIEWRFILPLLLGILLAIATLASALSGLLESHPRHLSAVFLGLVAGATVVASRDVRQPGAGHLLVAGLAAIVTFLALGATSGAVADPSLLAFFGAGAVAICAMILPGISGAFLLLLMGMYGAVIAAVDERLWTSLGVLALGCLVGLASFATLLNWLLREHHDVVLAALLGLLVGSSRVLWPWPGHEVGDPRLGAPVPGEVPTLGGLALGAFVAVWVLGRLARRLTRR